jgi:hypothetical protein
MGDKLPKSDYNIFKETGVKTDNHHLYKWGIVIGIHKDLQISQRVAISHSSLAGRVIAIDFVLGTSSGRGFIHHFVGVYALWNPGSADNDFWMQVTLICQQSPYLWTLAGDINTMVSTIECPLGGQDTRCQYLQFLHQSDGWDLWTLNPDRTRDHDWTCHARGSMAGGNIIDRVVLSNKGFDDTEIQVADKSSDYIPMTDHRAVIGSMNIYSPEDSVPTAARLKFSRDILAGYGKPCLRYPQRSEKHRFENFCTMVNEKIKDESIHNIPVNNDDSFILQYNALTRILKECSDAAFVKVKRSKHATDQHVTLPQIQRIQSDIRHLSGALQMTQEQFSGEVSHTSVMIYQRYLLSFQTNPGNYSNF